MLSPCSCLSHGDVTCKQFGLRQGRASAAKGAVVAYDGAGVPVEAAAELGPGAARVLARGAAVVQHAVAQHLQPTALQLRHAPTQKGESCSRTISITATLYILYCK